MIRRADISDLPKIKEIYSAARAFMCENGNAHQWGDTYPEEHIIQQDLQSGFLYVVESEVTPSEICGCFAMIQGNDPTYDIIDGAWSADTPYTAIHRVASNGSERGVLKRIMDFSKARCSHIRIDTHKDNLPMQNALAKNGFSCCGIIYLENGDPRLAYEWLLEDTMHNIKITDVRALPGDGAFLIDDGKTAILYDTGFAFTGYSVADNIKAVLGTRKLDYIFLTHSHYDHALGSVYIKKRFPEAKIVAAEYAQKIFQKPTARAVMRDLDRKFAEKCGISEYEDLIDELGADICVNDGDTLTCGDMNFTVIGLPGHTKCSIGFYLAKNALLLGCETLGVYGGDGVVVPSYLIGYQTTLDSIAKAEKMPIDNILVPHCGLLDKEETALYLKNGRQSAESTAHDIAEILNNGGSHEDAVKFFRDKFYNGYIKTIYPKDAMDLNTGIMVNLIATEIGRVGE